MTLSALLSLTWVTVAAGPASAAAADSCSVYWTGTIDDNWTVAGNWALTAGGTGTGRVPLNSDVACMSAAPVRTTVTYVSYSRTVAGIHFAVTGAMRPTLRIEGGVLTVGGGGGSFDSVINNLEVTEGGELRGTADYVLTGTPSLSDGTVLDGAGTTTLPAGVNVATTGLIVEGGRRLLVQGQLTHNGCWDYLYLYDGAVLQNSGRFTAASTCGLQVYSDGSPGSKVINDAGATFQITQAASATYRLDAPLENHGTVSVPNGSLVVQPSSSPNGTYDLGTGARLIVTTGGTLRIGPATLPGQATVTVSGGTLSVDPGVAVTTIDLQAGQLTGSPTVTNLTAAPGGTITGGGTVTVTPVGTAQIDGLVIDGGATLRNQGALSQVGCTAPITLRNGSTLTNEGTWTLPCGSAVQSEGSSGNLVRNATGGVIRSALPSAVQEYLFSARMTNDGTIEQSKGRIEILSLTNLAEGRLSGGSYVVTGGLIQIPGDVTTNAATIRLVSPGDLVTPTADTRALLRLRTNTGSLNVRQTLTTSTPVTNTGTVTVTANTLKPKSFTQTAGTTTVLTGATLSVADGPGAIDINGGTLTGGGRLGSIDGTGTIRPAMVMSVLGQYNPGTTGVLQIDINAPGNAGKLAVQGSSTLNGTLRLTTAAGYTPARGATFTILTTSRRVDTFDTVTGVNLPGGNYYDISYGNKSITITVKKLAQVTAADGAVVVGPAGDAPMAFDVTLDGPSSQEVTVDYATVEGSATPMLDFVPVAGQLIFPPGQTQRSVVVMVVQDLEPEPQETFSLALSNPLGAELARDTATGWIEHEAEAPTAPVVTGLTVPTIGLGASQVQRTVTGQHFVPGSLVSVTGTGLRLDSTQYVDSQTLVITLSGTAATTVGANDVVVTNPGLGVATCADCLSVTPRPQAAADGQWLATGASGVVLIVAGTDFAPGSSAKFTGGTGVTTTSQYLSPTSIQVTVTAYETATQGQWDVRVTNPDDGTGVCTGCMTVVAGPTLTSMDPAVVARGTTSTVTLTGSGFAAGANPLPPPDVTFTDVQVLDTTTLTATMTVSPTRAKTTDIPVTVVNPTSAGAGSARCGCLEVATLISAADVTATVGAAGPVDAVFQVRLDATSGLETRVDYTTVDGSAFAGADYEATSGTLVFPPNVTTMPVTVRVLPGGTAEPDQSFGLALSAPVNARLATTRAIATIQHRGQAVPAPEVTGVSPGTVGIGATARQVTLHGQRFHPTSSVAVSGSRVSVLETRFVSQTTLQVTLSAWTTATAGPRDVTVTTPGAGSSVCGGCLTVTAAPLASGASPALGGGATEREITVSGTGFVAGAQPVFRGGTGINVLATTFVSSTTLKVTVSVSATATVGTFDVRVTNPDGGTLICNACYRVVAGPKVLAMSPPVALRGTTLPVVISGTGFAQGATVRGPAGVRFTNVVFVNGTTLTALMSVDLARGRGVDLPITVVNPASAGYGEGTCTCLGVTV